MTQRHFWAVALLCILCAGVALAADISGTWAGSLQMADGPIALTFVFKQDGEKLTGSVATPGGDLPLNNGKVVGDRVSFYVEADMGGTLTKFLTEGVIKGDEIAMKTKAEGGEDFGAWALKRFK